MFKFIQKRFESIINWRYRAADSTTTFTPSAWLFLKSLPRTVQHLIDTFVGQAVLLFGLFLITRISADTFAATGFGEYQLARRTLALIAYPLLCGMGISLPRYLARDAENTTQIAVWLVAVAILAGVLQSACVAVALVSSQKIGHWVFGTASGTTLIRPLLICVVGQCAHVLACSALRGFAFFRFSAVLQTINGAAVPLAGLILSRGSVERALTITGATWVMVGYGVFAYVCYQRLSTFPKLQHVLRGIGLLLVYGAPRLPGEVALFGLFALPTYAAVHRNDTLAAGTVSVGLSLVQGMTGLFAAAGFVLLPYWSRVVKAKDGRAIAHRRISLVLTGSGLLMLVIVSTVQLFIRSISELLLGPLATSGAKAIRDIAFGAIPYVVYVILRDYFDAVCVFPFNTVALVVTIAVEYILLSQPSLTVLSATLASLLVLGSVMLAFWMRDIITAARLAPST